MKKFFKRALLGICISMVVVAGIMVLPSLLTTGALVTAQAVQALLVAGLVGALETVVLATGKLLLERTRNKEKNIILKLQRAQYLTSKRQKTLTQNQQAKLCKKFLKCKLNLCKFQKTAREKGVSATSNRSFSGSEKGSRDYYQKQIADSKLEIAQLNQYLGKRVSTRKINKLSKNVNNLSQKLKSSADNMENVSTHSWTKTLKLVNGQEVNLAKDRIFCNDERTQKEFASLVSGVDTSKHREMIIKANYNNNKESRVSFTNLDKKADMLNLLFKEAYYLAENAQVFPVKYTFDYRGKPFGYTINSIEDLGVQKQAKLAELDKKFNKQKVELNEGQTSTPAPLVSKTILEEQSDDSKMQERINQLEKQAQALKDILTDVNSKLEELTKVLNSKTKESNNKDELNN